MYQATQVRKQVSEIQSDLSESFLERRVLEHKHSPEGTPHIRGTPRRSLIIHREAQLSSLAASTMQLLSLLDELESELEVRTKENTVAVRAQQTAEHELTLCSVTLPLRRRSAAQKTKLAAYPNYWKRPNSLETHCPASCTQPTERSNRQRKVGSRRGTALSCTWRRHGACWSSGVRAWTVSSRQTQCRV